MRLMYPSMTYKLKFKTKAKKEWDKLNPNIQQQFKKKLIKCLETPRVEANKLAGIKDCYKIKLRNVGYRMVYQVRDHEVVVSVVAIGKRNRNLVYQVANDRLRDE